MEDLNPVEIFGLHLFGKLMMANFKFMTIIGIVLGVTALLFSTGCAFHKKTALENFLRKRKIFHRILRRN